MQPAIVDAAGTSEAQFGPVFSAMVEDATQRLRKLKKELARDCGIRPDRFSHLQAGSRRPRHREEVLRICHGLKLDQTATDRLLAAAGFALSGVPDDSPVGQIMDRLGASERAVAKAEMERDLALVQRAWRHYVDSQARNQARDWADASERHQEGVELYWQLRAMAARYLGQIDMTVSAADPHLNRNSEAEARCEEGLRSAMAAGSRPFEVMLLARLASIKRLRSDYAAAAAHYERALVVLDEWAAADAGGHRQPDREAWRAHWRARIQRMQGVLELFQGHPRRALRQLDASWAHFRGGEHWEELSQVCYGLGWAHGLLGDLEKAVSWDRQGLEYAELGNKASGRVDERSLLQGNLYLGGDYLDLNELASARTHLELARDLARHRQLRQYHEVGRVDLLLGKLEMRESAPQLAQPHLQAALEFFTGQEEQVLLATAHNTVGDFHLMQGDSHLQRALDHYAKALQAAEACRPPNTYYQCAALVNICRVRIRGGLPAPELAPHRDPASGSDHQWDPETLMERARKLGSDHRYLNHQARLTVLEAEWALQGQDTVAAREAAESALHLAHNFSPYLLAEVSADLERLGLPHRLPGAFAANPEPS